MASLGRLLHPVVFKACLSRREWEVVETTVSLGVLG